MHKSINKYLLGFTSIFIIFLSGCHKTEETVSFDRFALVSRNNIKLSHIDTLISLSFRNGKLVISIAMMAAGFEGSNVKNPGFPKDGSWNIKWEGLQPIL